MPSVNVRATTDGWVDEANQMQNNGGTSKLSLRANASSQRMAYIFFARPFPLGCAVMSAKLKVHLRGSWTARNIIVRRITEDWNENQLRWQNRPGTVGTNAVTETGVAGADQTEVSIDITTMMQDVAAGQAWKGVRLETTGSGTWDLSSAEAGAEGMRPLLEVRYAERPAAPTNLRPSGGASISKEQPRFEWDLPRRSRDDFDQIAYQVQVHTTTDFTSPEYNFAAFSAEPFHDSTDPGTLSIPEGATRYWRMRIANADGQWSPWSDTASFQRTAKGTLTLVSPDSGGVVEETTPPISWTFSGTQVSASIELERKRFFDGRPKWTTEWKLPRLRTSDTSWDVPKNIIKRNHTYRVTVRVWDDVERQATGGDPNFRQVQREFTYVRDGTPDPVDSIEVIGGTGPEVVVTWTRDLEPDYFSLVIDDQEEMQCIEPADVRVGSTDEFQMSWWRLEPGTTHTIEVEAVVNKKHSAGNPVATFEVVTGFKYFVYDDDELDPVVVRMLGKESTDLAVGETAETFNLVGERAPVRVTDSLRGYEGTVTGTLDGTAELKRLRRLKRRGRPVRYIQSTINVPVILGEMSVTPSPDAELFDVSIEVFQCGEFFDNQDD